MEEAENVNAKSSQDGTSTPAGPAPRNTGAADAEQAAARSTETAQAETGAATAETAPVATDTRNTGPGRLLIAVYAVFAISATARAGYQILTKFSEAPLAYLLSAFAAAVYVVATVSLAKPGRTAFKVSVAAVLVELVGVLVVGALSVFDSVNFPHETVWSLFGRGYGFIPLLLPILGLIWLYRRRPAPRQH
jgi:cobalamin biosynthesis Mg chelatase CobN